MTDDFSYDSADARLLPVEPTGVRTNMTYDTGPQQAEADRPVIVVEIGEPSASATPPEMLRFIEAHLDQPEYAKLG